MYTLTFGRDQEERWASSLSGADNGEPCSDDSDCSSGNCVMGYCLPRVFCGAHAHAEASGSYMGVQCACDDGYDGDPIQGCTWISNPQNFHAVACVNSGGTWANGQCSCSVGAVLDPVSARCISQPDSGCASSGGTWNGSSCDCGAGAFWDSISNTCSGVRLQCQSSGGTYTSGGDCMCPAGSWWSPGAKSGPGCYTCPPTFQWADGSCGCASGTYYDKTGGVCKSCAGNPGQCFSSGAPMMAPPPIAPRRANDVTPGPPPDPTTPAPPPEPSRTGLYIGLGTAAVIAAVGLGWAIQEDRRA